MLSTFVGQMATLSDFETSTAITSTHWSREKEFRKETRYRLCRQNGPAKLVEGDLDVGTISCLVFMSELTSFILVSGKQSRASRCSLLASPCELERPTIPPRTCEPLSKLPRLL